MGLFKGKDSSALEKRIAELEQELEATKHKLHVTEDELQNTYHHERILDFIFQKSHDMISISYLEDGVFIDVNPTFEEKSEYEKDELIGKSSLDLEFWKNPSDRDYLVSKLTQHGVLNNTIFEFLTRDKETRLGLFSAYAFSEEKSSYIITTISDITEQKVQEHRLSEANDRYQKLFDNMNSGFALHEIITDEDDNPIDYIFLDFNPAFKDITGLDNTIRNQRVTDVLSGIKEDPADWIGRYGKVALTGTSDSFIEYSEPLERWYAVRAYSPELGKFATIIDDITDQKKAEMKQAELLKEKDILLHDVNHRVKNNLAIISGLLHLQLDSIPYDTPCRDELQGAAIRIDAMNALHNALYTETGETELFFKGYLDNVLASIEELFSEEIHNIQIQKQVDDDFEPARKEYVPYGLLITEVITNSYKYAYPTKTGDIDLELKASKDGALDHMKIQDFGKGIDTGFTNGLGTNLIYQLADQVHLHASRQSEVGEGTCWLFTPQGNSDTNNVTYDGIYIVEDERLIALSLKKTLENEGYSVIDIASSGREAIDELTTLAPKPQAVIMDIKLEDDISGIDVAYAIKNEKIPIVFRSAYIDDPLKEKIQNIGLSEYEAIDKSAPMKRLLDVINSYVT